MDDAGGSHIDSDRSCVFAKALLAGSAECRLAERHALAERVVLGCRSPVARTNCATLSALLHERARFALRLPASSQPPTHLQALRLQCGGLLALHSLLGSPDVDVHGLVQRAQERYGSLVELPWTPLVAELALWQPRRRHHPRA
jgi:hypothetical protein